MKCLNQDELNQLPVDARVWIVIDTADPNGFLKFPMNLDWELGLFAFLEERDAEHMERLLKEKADNYKDMELGIRDHSLRSLGLWSIEAKTPLCVLDHDSAMEFFTRYLDVLDQYRFK